MLVWWKCWKSTFASHESTAVRDAISCLAVCVCENMANAGMSGRNVNCATNQLFFSPGLHCKERSNVACALRSSNSKQKKQTNKKPHFCSIKLILIEQPTIRSQIASSLGALLTWLFPRYDFFFSFLNAANFTNAPSKLCLLTTLSCVGGVSLARLL